ncbi:MAG TPA: TetR/AcrR family transcriptional regulator [Alkalispirochaeta sp.]|nr:TetR/AcrR family transcriptional regulator [Alkalispirochaeta sp.]
MDTKQEILATARELFAQSGYEAVGIQQICTAVGVTKPALYYHFGNKETLLKNVAADATSAFLASLSPQAPPSGTSEPFRVPFSGDLVSDVRSLFAAILRFSRTDPARFQIILQLLYPPRGSVLGRLGEPELARIHSSLAHFFSSAAAAHGNLSGKKQFLAAVFVGHAIALAMFISRVDQELQPDSPQVVQATQTFLYGIF